MSQMSDEEKSKQGPSQWADLMGQLFDRLTGKGAEIAYNFQNLEIDIPRAVGPQGQNLGGAKWTINGRLIITAQAHKSSDLK
jgi:hypothetical protein